MILKLLLLLIVILIVLFFLIFFKTWHIHITFENDNLDYSFNICINFLLFEFLIYTIEETSYLDLKISLFSKTYNILNLKLSKKETEETVEEVSEDNEDKLNKVKQLFHLLEKSKKDLFDIVKLFGDLLKFDESYVIMNLGLQDNNLTIKFCSFLWALSAPLYPFNFRLCLTPEMNKLLFKSNINLKFDFCLKNLLKIVLLVIERENLQDIIKFILK